MVRFQTAQEASIDAFLSVSRDSRYHRELEAYADALLRQRCTRPEWCLVGTDEGVLVARGALWSLPEQPIPSDVVLIEADWTDEDLPAGRALMDALHDRARALGADTLMHSIDAPPEAPQYQEDEEARVRLLETSGYELLRDGFRWSYRPTAGDPPPPRSSLAFRSLAEVGEDAFVEAIAETYEGTRDPWITESVRELGPLEAARSDFLEEREMDQRPEWWELAYTDDGALAGVIMAARNPTSAVIAYVGVVPKQRGRGFSTELVRRGTATLLEAGATEVRGDCDRDNVAMVKAFERSGFERFARRRTYQVALGDAS